MTDLKFSFSNGRCVVEGITGAGIDCIVLKGPIFDTMGVRGRTVEMSLEAARELYSVARSAGLVAEVEGRP